METFRVETIVSQNHVLTIRGLPFRVGEKVEVIVMARAKLREMNERYPLRGKPIRYAAPFDGVAEKDWNALK